MEQATNLFTKGLLMDTNPMVLGTDTLTDCLNGTITTMTGNEVILQNDMGNRRVDNAFLPSGYLPVGMKEYGGIIYIAAYNPITNKSLIGSFPSPEKKMDSKDSPDLENSFDFDSILNIGTNVEVDTNLGIDVIKSDSFMIPLTGNISLRAGDKFAIYSPNLSSLSSSLTNYNNILGNKAYSPKNRKYTLQVGILNSLNEFVDITKTLCRWKNTNGNWKPKVYDSEVSETFKFNDEYFIADGFSDIHFFDTVNNSELIKHRQILEANTYSYKLVGPMYLKVNFNHIENFNYNIYGLKNDGSQLTYTLWIEGYLTYNCPDGASGPFDNNSDENYATFEEGNSTFSGFELINKAVDTITRTKSIYDPKTNLYTTKIVKKYLNIIPTLDNIYEYVIGVRADKDANNIYLRGLSVKGQIDLSLLGSGKVYIKGWRFYNNILKKLTILTFSFNAYPKYGESFGNLRFKFHDITNGSDSSNDFYYFSEGLPLYNGRLTYTFNWNESFEPRKVYKVEITYDIFKDGVIVNSDLNPDELEGVKRWILTTELFNEFYNSSGVEDFCNTNDLSFKNKMNIKLTVASDLINYTQTNKTFEGGLLSTTNDISYEGIYSHELNITNNSSLQITNEELYPDYIKINPGLERTVEFDSNPFICSIGNITLNSSSTDAEKNTALKSLLVPILGNDTTTHSTNPFNNASVLIISNLETNNNVLYGTIQNKDIIKAYNTVKVSNIYNAFDKLETIIDDALPQTNHKGVVANYNLIGGTSDHFVDVAKDSVNGGYILDLPNNNELPEGWDRVTDEVTSSHKKSFSFLNILDSVFNSFNSDLDTPGQMFLFLFQGGYSQGLYNYTKLYFDISNKNWEGNNNFKYGQWDTRLWWRTYRGEWAVFKNLLHREPLGSSNPNTVAKQFILSELGRTYVYCMWDNYTNNSLLLYPKDTDYIYYDRYLIPLVINVNYKLNSGVSIEDIINTEYLEGYSLFGNLEFDINHSFENLSDKISINLESSEEFHDNIHSFNKNSISNIYVEGILLDSKGRALDPNYIYYKDLGTLVRVDNSNFIVDFENTINGKNTLVYNKYSYNRPKYPYQHAYKEGYPESSHTVINYTSVNVIEMPL